MTKQEIFEKLDVCISIVKANENTYVTRTLIEISQSLANEWNATDMYSEQIKKALRTDDINELLNNIQL
tara:strand:- start:3628 stop:3834 length:207 start_codon:yes stop_codon:yes gene_type:complete